MTEITLVLLILATFNLGILTYILHFCCMVYFGPPIACWLMSKYGIKVVFTDQYGNKKPGWMRGKRAYKLLMEELYSENK